MIGIGQLTTGPEETDIFTDPELTPSRYDNT